MATRILLLFAAALAVARAQLHAHDLYNAAIERMWHTADTDNNGQLSRDELAAVFQHYDTNHDGRVSRHEYTSMVTEASATLHDYSHALFDIFDSNGDHHLDDLDLDALYAKMNVDGRSSVSEADFSAFWHTILADTAHLHGHGIHLHPVG